MDSALGYTLTGVVVRGKQMGRKLGFPTANIAPDVPVSGLGGVYAGCIDWGDGPRPCMVNIGRHPTLPEGPSTVEAHIPGYSGNLYGTMVSLTLDKYLRSEQKFPSLEALTAQLQRDVEQTLQYYEGRTHAGISE